MTNWSRLSADKRVFSLLAQDHCEDDDYGLDEQTQSAPTDRMEYQTDNGPGQCDFKGVGNILRTYPFTPSILLIWFRSSMSVSVRKIYGAIDLRSETNPCPWEISSSRKLGIKTS